MRKSETTIFEHTYANQLKDMKKIDWREGINGDQVLVRLSNLTKEETKILQNRFELDHLQVQDIFSENHPPFITRLPDETLHIIIRFPVVTNLVKGEQYKFVNVSVIADKKVCAIVWPNERYHQFSNRDYKGLSIDECVGKIIHGLVDYLFEEVAVLWNQIDEIEDVCLDDPSNADMVTLLTMRKNMSVLARIARGNDHVLDKLISDPLFLNNPYLLDAHEHMARANVAAESKAEHALIVMQAVQSLLSQKLNELMKVLAVLTAVLTPMMVIGGVFGMNFIHMDVLSNPSGFIYTLMAMVVSGLAPLAYFKYKKLL